MAFTLKEFVIVSLWRKLPVAQRLSRFGVLKSQDCHVCAVIEDHDHVFEKCHFVQASPTAMGCSCMLQCMFTRRCNDHHALSLTTIQGWLVWSAVYTRWFIRCEALSAALPDPGTSVLQLPYVILLSW